MRNYGYILLFMLCFFGVSLIGQSQEKGKYSKVPSGRSINYDTVVDEKLNQAEALLDTDPIKAIQLVEDALSISIDNYNQKGQGESYYLLGVINFSLNEFGLAKVNFLKAKDVFSLLKMTDNNYKVIKSLGETYEQLGELNNALSFYRSFESLAKKKNNQVDVLYARQAIANILAKQGELDAAEEMYQGVLEDADAGAPVQMEINTQLGKLKEKQNKKSDAKIYYQKSQSIAESINDNEKVNEAFKNQYEAESEPAAKLEVKQQALDYNTRSNNIPQQVDDNIDIAEIYLEKDEPEQAIEYLEESIALSGNVDDLEGKSRALEVISKAYDKVGQTEQALRSYKEYLSLEAILNQRRDEELRITAERGRKLEQVQSEVEILEKNKELNEKTIELLKKEKMLNESEINRQQLLIYGLLFIVLLVVLSMVLILKNAKQKRVAHQLLMLKSLRAQMNPHFIFNALNSVNNFISKNDERAANKYLSDFSKLMRQVLDNSHHDFIPLSVEIEILELYTKLEHFRFQDKFDYEFEVDSKLDREGVLIPPMLIQPYIENAVWHGLRYKDAKGHLSIRLEQLQNGLKVTVADNGIGRKQSQALKTKNQKAANSLGMKNVIDRLSILNTVYNTNITVNITNLKHTGDIGTKVEIIIPEIASKSIER